MVDTKDPYIILKLTNNVKSYLEDAGFSVEQYTINIPNGKNFAEVIMQSDEALKYVVEDFKISVWNKKLFMKKGAYNGTPNKLIFHLKV
jgi:hypothetical protein